MTAFQRAMLAAVELIDQDEAGDAELTAKFGVRVRSLPTTDRDGVTHEGEWFRLKFDADGRFETAASYFPGLPDAAGIVRGVWYVLNVAPEAYGIDLPTEWVERCRNRVPHRTDRPESLGPAGGIGAVVEPDAPLSGLPAAEPDEPVPAPPRPVVPEPAPAGDRPRVRSWDDFTWRPVDGRLFR